MRALHDGWQLFTRTAWISAGFAGVFGLAGLGLGWALVSFGVAPMTLPLAGGFLLLAPGLLSGFFAVSAAHRKGLRPGWRELAGGFLAVPRALWGLLLVCGFLFVIWMTDASILYSFMVGDGQAGWEMLLPVSGRLVRFQIGVSLAGAFFALIVFFVTAYAVPLLIERRANLAVAVTASVRAIIRSPAANALWGLTLAVVLILSVLIPPLLAVALPVTAYAGESLYRATFPDEPEGA
jgi:uncharacterized membrane protein